MAGGPPDRLCCPITHELMTDPVIMSDGHTYEREAISQWLAHNPTSPMTRQPMQMSDARTNLLAKSMIDSYRQENASHSPPSLIKPSASAMKSCPYKVAVLGSSYTGKTSIIRRKVVNEFSQEYQSTIGCICVDMRVALGESEVELSFWDTNGTEKYKSVTPFYLRDSNAILLVFDITELPSFKELVEWAKLASDSCPDAHLFVVANKIDLDAGRCVGREEAQEFAERLKAPIFEVSALTGNGIDKLFVAVAEKVRQCRPVDVIVTTSVTTSVTTPVTRKTGCCS
jgi:Ras-related protein Rab-5C